MFCSPTNENNKMLESDSEDELSMELDDFVTKLNDLKKKKMIFKPMFEIDLNKKIEINYLKEGISKFDPTTKCIILNTADFNTFLPSSYVKLHSEGFVKKLNDAISKKKIKYFFEVLKRDEKFKTVKLHFSIKKNFK